MSAATSGATRRLRDGSFQIVLRAWRMPGAKPALIVFSFFVVVALIAPMLAPYGPFERVRLPNGELARSVPPSLDHPFGTTAYGRDVLSQVIWGTSRTLSVGFVGAFVTVLIGVNVGLIAGYRGGRIDATLMRITDSAYAIPFLPFAIVLVGILGRSDAVLLLAIGLLFWRATARVVRAQVLTLKERTFVRAAVVSGAQGRRVLYRHLAPNVLPLALLYGVLLVCEAVIAEASLSFLGLAPPNSISWGTIMFDAFTSTELRSAWWWAFFPGLAVTTFVLSTTLIGRAYDQAQRARMEGGRR